ncbi:MAG: hypothetical protein QOI09_1150 [Chloroflexota bacterium]|jgi:hypothetical protein|nr:hypothetical protein [Chloroflexota bacterium]
MPFRVEIYAADGVAIAVVARSGSLREIVESGSALLLERATWHPIDGSPPEPRGELSLAPDDIHIAVGETVEEGPVHAQWHDVMVDVGPYHVTGQMPTMPGFDPGRALARPTGEFVLLRDVQVALVGREDDGSVGHPSALVNRYVVDRVEADLMLGFFFPGAVMVVTGGRDSVAAGATDVAAATVAPPGAATDAAPSPAEGTPSVPGVA